MASRLRRDASPRASFFSFLDIITSVTGVLILVTLLLSTDLGGLTPEPTGATPSDGDESLKTALQAQAQVEAQNALLRRLIAAAAAAGSLPELQAQVVASKRELESLESSVANTAVRTISLRNGQKQQDATLGIDEFRARLSARRASLASLEQTNEVFRATAVDLGARIVSASSRLSRARALSGQSWLRPDNGSAKVPQVILVSGSGVEFKPLNNEQTPSSWPPASAERGFSSFCRDLDSTSQYVVFLIRPSGIDLFQELVQIARQRGLDVGYDAIAEHQVINVGQPSLDDPAIGPSSPPEGNNGARGPSSAPEGATPGAPAVSGFGASRAPAGHDNQAAAANATGTSAAVPQAAATAAPSSTSQPIIITNNAGGAQPPPPLPKPKSWWERLVEFIKGLFA
jgi:hypothetical protein